MILLKILEIKIKNNIKIKHEEIKNAILNFKIVKHTVTGKQWANCTDDKGEELIGFENGNIHVYFLREEDSHFSSHPKYNVLIPCEWSDLYDFFVDKTDYEIADPYGSIYYKNGMFFNDYGCTRCNEVNTEIVRITSLDKKGNIRSTAISYNRKFDKIICTDDVYSKLPLAMKRINLKYFGGKRGAYRFRNGLSIKMVDYPRTTPIENKQNDKHKNDSSYPRLLLKIIE
jgi:hypothetical protein